MSSSYYPEEFPVPYTEVIFDRIMLEIMRGCTRGCRFCQAGILYRPVRERSLEKLIDLAEKLQSSTGYEEISLSSLSSGDYSCLPELIRELMKRERLPIGYALKREGKGRWYFVIYRKLVEEHRKEIIG